MATTTALRAAQMVAAEIEFNIRVGKMVGALYAEFSDFLVLIF